MKADPRRIGAIEVGFRLVRVLEAADSPLSLKELSDRAGMPASKAYAYVASFVHEGFVTQDPLTARYGLGPFAMAIGLAALRQSDLLESVRRNATALSETTTCSVILSTWGNRGPTIVYRIDGKRRGPTSVRVGYVVPIWRSATGRIFVAYLPAGETEPLLRAEEGSRVRAEAVRAESARIRKLGIASAAENGDFAGLAAPILDHDGHLVAALTLSRPFDNDTAERRRELAGVLRAAAAAVSREIGYAPAETSRPAVKGQTRARKKLPQANHV